ncbi:hypothetical protein BD324DRAFT_622303 [Kockovaella imperatae]|uniref:Xylanolytic transcriptional activator regulatory domain-containing protein n=1 Tax=Kockovaella imperatae TaxID=4999 RepID=A0A1Y1UHL3_9TREE|nr:hypothetical protein BD324DRAFT_622303 [Kockovaella imperatae]ORX37541.1 hypothetical protein BD324DRAFT_622303 [Kockovaella imperatae]
MRDTPDAPTCHRCQRFGLPCHLPSIHKRRGRPPKQQQQQQVSNDAVVPAPYVLPHFSSFTTSTDSRLPPVHHLPRPLHRPIPFYEAPARAGPSTLKRTRPLSAGAAPTQPHASSSGQHSNPTDMPTAYSDPSTQLSTSPGDERRRHHKGSNVDVSDYLDPGERVFMNNAPKGPFYLDRPLSEEAISDEDEEAERLPLADGMDPVLLRILTEVEAHALIQIFLERLNPQIAVFDAKLHTVPYLRRTSSILFTSALAVSAKFYRQDLYPVLLAHAQAILDRAVCSGKHDIGIVQSLMLLTYWKVPEDTTAWIKIGLALRMGYQNFWHVPRTGPLPPDEMSARETLNAERTWFCLFCFDRGLSQTFGLPTATRPDHFAEAESWARGHLDFAPLVDMHLALSFELCKLKDHWRALFQSHSPAPRYVESAIDLLVSQCDALLARWFNKDNPPPDFHWENEHSVKWSILDFILILQRQRLDLNPTDPLRLDMCLGVASEIVDLIAALADNGGLAVLQDTASCMTSSLAVLLHKIFRQTSTPQKSLVISLLQRILLYNTRVSNGDTNCATAFVARFARRTLSAIGNESRAGSPGHLNNADGSDPLLIKRNGERIGGTQPDFMAQLEEYMQVSEEPVQASVDDQQYW